jgi:hypothetical protein
LSKQHKAKRLKNFLAESKSSLDEECSSFFRHNMQHLWLRELLGNRLFLQTFDGLRKALKRPLDCGILEKEKCGPETWANEKIGCFYQENSKGGR